MLSPSVRKVRQCPKLSEMSFSPSQLSAFDQPHLLRDIYIVVFLVLWCPSQPQCPKENAVLTKGNLSTIGEEKHVDVNEGRWLQRWFDQRQATPSVTAKLTPPATGPRGRYSHSAMRPTVGTLEKVSLGFGFDRPGHHQDQPRLVRPSC